MTIEPVVIIAVFAIVPLALAGVGIREITTQRRILPRLGGRSMSPTRCGVSAICCSVISLSMMISVTFLDPWGQVVPLVLCVAFAVIDLVLARRSRSGRDPS